MNSRTTFFKTAFFLSALLLFIDNSFAQWETNGPYGGRTLAFQEHNSMMFIGTERSVYRSADNGVTWTFAGKGIDDIIVQDLETGSAGLFAGTGLGVYLSTDNGASWVSRNNGLTGEVISLFQDSDGLYAGTTNGVYFSSDDGASWTARNTGIPQAYKIHTWAAMGDSVFAGSYAVGMYLSTDNGQNWTIVGNGFPNAPFPIYVYDLYTMGNTIFAGTNHGLYRSTDRGATWSTYGSGITPGNHLFAITSKPGYMVAASPPIGIYVSTDGGQNWTISSSGLKNWAPASATYDDIAWINDLVISGQNILAASDEGVYLSSNNASAWQYSDNGIQANYIRGVAITSGAILAGSASSGMYVSLDKGQSWARANNGLTGPVVGALAANSTHAFVSIINRELFRTSDNGTTWTSASAGLPNTPMEIEANDQQVVTLHNKSSINGNTKIFRSTDNGLTWAEVPTVLSGISAITIDGLRIYAGNTNGSLSWTDDNGVTWHDFTGYMPQTEVSSILSTDNYIYIGTLGQGMFRFNADGSNMQNASSGLSGMWVSDIIEVQNILFSASYNTGVHASTNNGMHWFDVNEGLEQLYVHTLAAGNDMIYASTKSGVYQSGEDSEFFAMVKLLSGIPANSEESMFRFYPNPSDGLMHFETENPINYEVYNNLGQVVQAGSSSSTGLIDLRGEDKGLYFVKITDGKLSTTKKIIVK